MEKLHFNNLGEIIRYCTAQNRPFALYSLPDEKQIHCIVQDSAEAKLEENSPLPSAPGFILYPFIKDENTPAYFIRNEYTFSFLDTDISEAELTEEYMFDTPLVNNTETTEAAHCKKVEKAIININKGELDKVILSRVQSVKLNVSPINTYVELFEKYPSAFVSLVYIPGKVLWLTASPELLVTSAKNEIETVALAGTKKAGKADWTEKEKKEQQLVTDYIQSVLENHCEHIIIEGPKDAVAGNVTHLKTTFTAELDSGLWDLVTDLHPTPAVCGIPKEKAQKFISNTEAHSRKYYSGFLGPCNVDGETNLFVNLRCAELSSTKADLFVGGGITSDSVPQAEWDETVLKANTLLSVLKPVAEKPI